MAEKNFLISIDKGMIMSASLLGILYIRNKKLDLALKYLPSPSDTNSSDLAYQIGERLLLAKHDSLAEKYFDETISQDPKRSFKIANLLFSVANFTIAEKYFKVAIQNKIPKSAATFALYVYSINGDRNLAADCLRLERDFIGSDESLILATEVLLDLWGGNFEGIMAKTFKCNYVRKLDNARKDNSKFACTFSK